MHLSRRVTSNRPAFTLIELLVVITVIGILAALLVTAINGAKEKARQIQCVNNVHQLGIGLQLFVQDNNVYPLMVNMDFQKGTYPNQSTTWIGTLGRVFEYGAKKNGHFYTKGIWHCPSLKNSPEKEQLSYGYNAYGVSPHEDTDSLGLGGHRVWTKNSTSLAPPVAVSDVISPVEMMAIADGAIGGNGVIIPSSFDFWRRRSVEDDGSGAAMNARHQGKANVLFCDGHVESPTLKFLFEDTSDAALVRWNRDHQPHRDKL
jgi:prepilin-type processing-associated H-X9-DG protein/prepilin-type N-terminal cleavage/methylation domain-containing protein